LRAPSQMAGAGLGSSQTAAWLPGDTRRIRAPSPESAMELGQIAPAMRATGTNPFMGPVAAFQMPMLLSRERLANRCSSAVDSSPKELFRWRGGRGLRRSAEVDVIAPYKLPTSMEPSERTARLIGPWNSP